MDDKKEMEIIACFVHGILAVLHFLGVIHNLRRKNWSQAGLHFAVMCYDFWAVIIHCKDVRRSK